MCVLVLVRLVAPNLLADEQERKEVLDEVEDEMTKFGPIERIRLDERPISPAAGTIYVHFTSPADAATAANAMQGRRFDGRPVIAKLVHVSEMSARLGTPLAENRLVVLPGIVDGRAFTDAAERADIALDIREEMLQFAESVDVDIPIPPDPDAGAALIRFPEATAAHRAVEALQGRLFDGRPVRPYLR
ncbi:U2 small nuclear RNA auxiliary factor 2 [Cyanidiococcus yangmingshanensis]|uniref:U2 small nuclear RNA auxiliary factor 2 n=1 Tax=Cyanidiococcus yangmingshanensis TaxID=2690220 RepID=A0A7J7IM65_9RHOD|nr:U2 small nuclear RNA auxiliary factor 2 [Cyanidiococcus yangmingshanensis]